MGAKTHFLLTESQKGLQEVLGHHPLSKRAEPGVPGSLEEHEASLVQQTNWPLHKNTGTDVRASLSHTPVSADCLPGRKWKAAGVSVYNFSGGVS